MTSPYDLFETTREAVDKFLAEDHVRNLMNYIDVVFDGPPGHESGRFVEVENSEGISIRIGEWIQRPDGYWVLRIQRDALNGRDVV